MPRAGRDCRLGRGSPGSLPSDRTRWPLSPGFCRILGGGTLECVWTESLRSRIDGPSRAGSSTLLGQGSHDVEPALDIGPGHAAGPLGMSLVASDLADRESDDSFGGRRLALAFLWRHPSLSCDCLVHRPQFHAHHACPGNGANHSLDLVGTNWVSLFPSTKSKRE